jgi:predicted RNase H-like HicB family nuclease
VKVVDPVARTEEQASKLMRDAIQLHLDDLRKKNLPAPTPASKATEVEILA